MTTEELVEMGTRVKKERRKNKLTPPPAWRVGTPVFDLREMDAFEKTAKSTTAVRVIYDATGGDLGGRVVSEEEFTEAAKGYLVGGTVKMPGGGEIAIATVFAASAPGDHATEPLETRAEPVNEPLMDKPEILDIDSGLDAFGRWVETVLSDGNITNGELEGFGVFYFPCSERIEHYLSAQYGMAVSAEKKTIVPLMWLAHRNRSLLPRKERERLERLLRSAHFGSNPTAAFRRLANDPFLFLGEVA
jgi:hypothetical protein